MFGIDFDFRINGEKVSVDTIDQLDAFIQQLSTLKPYLRPLAAVQNGRDGAKASSKTREVRDARADAFNIAFPYRTIDYALVALVEAGRTLRTREITNLMLSGGWPSTSPKPAESVGSIIRRYPLYVTVEDGAINLTAAGSDHAFKVLDARKLAERSVQSMNGSSTPAHEQSAHAAGH